MPKSEATASSIPKSLIGDAKTQLFDVDVYVAGKLVSSVTLQALNETAAERKTLAQVKLDVKKHYVKGKR